MALKSKALKKASKAAKTGAKGNRQVDRVVANAPKATKYGLKAAANTFVPFYSKTAQSFAKQHRDLKNWVRNSSPFRSSQGSVPANERRITNNAKTVLAAFKTDIKKGHLLDFRNTNAAFNKAIGGITEEGFDDNYDAEMMGNDAFGESSDSNVSNQGPADYDAMFSELLGNDTFIDTQQAATSATLDSIDNATGAVTDAVVGAADYTSNRITAGVNVAISHLAEYQVQTNEILTDMNNNLASLVELNNYASDFHNQALDFFQKTESSLNQLVELTKYSVGKTDERYRDRDEDPYDFLAGGKFDIKKYGKMLWNSQAGTLVQGVIGQMNPILKLFGIDIGDKVSSLYRADEFEFKPIEHYYEKSPLKRIFDAINENTTSSIKMFFHRLAKGQFSTGIGWIDDLLRTFAQSGAFGKAQYGNVKNAYVKGYDNKNMAHLTEATVKTIENVIPDYLSGIEGYLRNIYEGIYDGSMASTFEFLNPEASVNGRREKEIEAEINRIKYGSRSQDKSKREEMYAPINTRLDTIIDILNNGVSLTASTASGGFVGGTGTSTSAGGKTNTSNKSQSIVVMSPMERKYQSQIDDWNAAIRENEKRISSRLKDINRSLTDNETNLPMEKKLNRYRRDLLKAIDEFLIDCYGFSDDELKDKEIEYVRDIVRTMKTKSGPGGIRVLSFSDIVDELNKTDIIKSKIEAQNEEARKAANSPEARKRRSDNIKEYKAEKARQKQAKDYYKSQHENLSSEDIDNKRRRAEQSGGTYVSRYQQSIEYANKVEADQKREEERRKREEEEDRKRIAELQEELSKIQNQKTSMGSTYSNAITQAKNRQDAIRNKTVGNDNRIFDIKSGKFTTAKDIRANALKQLDSARSSAYSEFVEQATKLIGNKETKNEDRLKEISDFLNNLPADIAGNDQIANQLFSIFIKDGDIESSLDLEGSGVAANQVPAAIVQLYMQLVKSSEDYTRNVNEIMSSIESGESAALNIARSDPNFLKELNKYAQSNGVSANAKWYNFNKGSTAEERAKQIKEWKKTVEEAFKNNHDTQEVENARRIFDDLMTAYDDMKNAEQAANATGSSKETQKAAQDAKNAYRKLRRRWTSNSIGKTVRTFDDGMALDDGVLSLFRDSAEMEIDDPIGAISLVTDAPRISVRNPNQLLKLAINRLPLELGLSHDNDMYRAYKDSFSGDMSFGSLIKGIRNWFGVPSVSKSNDDDESEGSGWGDHYSQLSYGDRKYGNTTMAKGACGPVALANAFNRLGIQVDPVTMAAISEAMGYAVDGGTSAGLFTDGVNSLGLSGSEIGFKAIPNALRSGRQVILSGKSVGGGMYTPAGHIISLNGIHGNRVGVDDPLKKHATSKSLGDVLKGARHAWSVGSGEGDSTVENLKSQVGSMVENGKEKASSAAKAVTKFGKDTISSAGLRAKAAFGQAGTDFVAQETVLLSGLYGSVQDMGGVVKSGAETLFGPTGWITKKIDEEKKKARDKKLFGEKDENGFYKGGLLSAKTANYIKEMPQMFRHAMFGDAYTSYANGRVEESEGFVDKQRRERLIKKYGENYRDDPRYQALPDNLKDYEDREYQPKLKMANAVVGDNGVAKDTYDYGKYRRLPCGGEIRGWTWEDDGWKFIVSKDGKNERITLSGDWTAMLTDSATIPSLTCTEAAMKQAEISLRNKTPDDGQLLHHRAVPMTKMDGFLSFMGVKNESVLGPNGEAYDTNDYASVESKVDGLSILGWRYDNKAECWKFHYSFRSTQGKGKEFTFNTALSNKDILPPDSLTLSLCQSLVAAKGSGKWDNESIENVNNAQFDALIKEYEHDGKDTMNHANIRKQTTIGDNSFSSNDVVWQKDEKAKCWKLVYTKSNGDVSETVFPNYNNLSAAPDERATRQAMKFVDNIEADEKNKTHKRGLFRKGTKGTSKFKQSVDESTGTVKSSRVASSFYDAIYDANDAVEDIKKKGRAKRWLWGTMGLMLGGPTTIIPAMIAGTAVGAFEKTDFGKNTKAFLFGGKDAKGEKQQGIFGGALGKIKSLLMGKNVLGGVVGAIIGGMMGGPAGALAGASVLSHLMEKGSKLRKMLFGGRDENGKWQWSPLMKGIKGILKFIFGKGHRLGAIAGGVLGASMGPLGWLLGSAIGGHIVQPATRKVLKFGNNIRKGSKIKSLAEKYQNHEITLDKVRKKLGKKKVGNATDEELASFLNAGSDVHQKWLDSGMTLAEFYRGQPKKKNTIKGSESDAADAAKAQNIKSEGQGITAASLAEIDAHDKLEKEAMEANVETPTAVEKIYNLLNNTITQNTVNRKKEKHDAEEAAQTKHAREGSLKKDDEEVNAASQGDHDEEAELDTESKKGGVFSSIVSGASSLFSNLGIKGLAIGAGALFAFSKLKDTKLGKWLGNLVTKGVNGLGSLIGSAIEKIDWSSLVTKVGDTLVDVITGAGDAAKSAGELAGKFIDKATNNRTNFSSYDDNGNKNGNFLDNITGTTYSKVVDPETGETKFVSDGPSFSNSTISQSLINYGANLARRPDKVAEMVGTAGMNVYNHSFATGGLKYVGKSKGLGKVLAIVRGFIDTIIQGVSYLASKSKVLNKLANVGTTIKNKIANLMNSPTMQKEIGTNNRFTEAVTKITGGAVIKSTMTAAFVAYGLVAGGAWGCNDLFGIEENELHGMNVKLDVPVMRGISGVFSALIDSNIPGSIFGLVNDLVYTVLGVSIKRLLATALYNVIETGKGEEGQAAIEALEKAQTAQKKRLQLYNAATGESLSQSEYQTAVELTEAETFWQHMPKWMQSKKFKEKLARREEIINATNQAEAENINAQVRAGTFNSDDLYQNMSVENMSADDDSEGYGAPKSVGYGASNSTHFSQLDKTWRNVDFGKMTNGSTTTIGTGGCGPTALANVARNLTGNKSITPSTVASMAQDYGYTANGGSAASLFTEGASRLGLSSRRVSLKNVPSTLASGHKLILSGKRKGAGSPYTDAGHIISVNGIKNGKAIVDDPLKSTTETLSVNKLLSGAKKAWVVDKGNVGYGTMDPQEYYDNLQSMGYGISTDGTILEINDANLSNQSIYGYPIDFDVKTFKTDDQKMTFKPVNTDHPPIFYEQGDYDNNDSTYPSVSARLWSSKKFGDGTWYDNGCFPTAFAEVFSSLTGLDIDPLTFLARYATHWTSGINGGSFDGNYDDMFMDLYGKKKPKGAFVTNDMSTNDIVKMDSILRDGGAAWVDAVQGAGFYHGYVGKSGTAYAGGHSTMFYGSMPLSSGDCQIINLNPGRGYNSTEHGGAVTSYTLGEFAKDIEAGKIKRVALFPKVPEGQIHFIKQKFDTVWDHKQYQYLRRGTGTGNAVPGSVNIDYQSEAAQQHAKDAQYNQENPWVPDQEYIEKLNDLDYSGPNYADWDPDDSLSAKISNIMLALSGIGERFVEKLFDGNYKSVFGSQSSSGSGSGSSSSSSYDTSNQYNDATATARGGFYFVKTPNGKKEYVSVSASSISDNMSESQLSSVIDDVMSKAYSETGFVRWYYSGGKSKIDTNGSYNESDWKLKDTADAEDKAMFSKYIMARKTIRANLADAIGRGNMYNEGYFHIPLELKDKNDNVTNLDFTTNIGSKNTIRSIFDEIRSQYPNSYSALKSSSDKKYYISDDDIWSGIKKSIDSNNDGVFDSGASVYDVDGSKISNYSAFEKDNSTAEEEYQKAYASKYGASASDAVNSNLDFEVVVPNGLPMEYANTGLDKSMIGAKALVAENHADPGYAYAGNIAKSKLSNAYGLANISTNPSRYGATESISPSQFKQSTIKTVFRDLRKFPPISAERLDQMINDLTASNSESTMRGTGQDFVDASNLSGIDPRALIVQAGIESGWGTSALARDKGNLFGISAYDGSAYASGTDFTENGKVNLRKSILTAAEWISRNYINNQSGVYDPQCTAAQLGWSDSNVYGSGELANGTPYRTAYGNGMASILAKAEGYGDIDTSSTLLDDNDIDPGMKAFFNTSSSSSSTEGFGIGNSSTRNSMSISATRSYAPKTSIDNSNSTRINAPVDVNVDLNTVETQARNMVALLERIASNTGRSTGGTTNITNNYDGHKEVGYGDITVNQSSKTTQKTVVPKPQVNNNHIDKFRKIHNMVAKSSR